jgi:hypothetical protein
MCTSASLYHRHRFPNEIISHCVWLYFRFPLTLREVEEMMRMRGIILTYETVREWCLKFARPTPTDCAAGLLGPATVGTSMKYSSGSMGVFIICGQR